MKDQQYHKVLKMLDRNIPILCLEGEQQQHKKKITKTLNEQKNERSNSQTIQIELL